MHDTSRKHGCQAPWNVHQVTASPACSSKQDLCIVTHHVGSLLQVAGIVLWWAVVAGFLALHLPLLSTAAARAGVAVVYCACVVVITAMYLAVR
jgi:hypothetical protein